MEKRNLFKRFLFSYETRKIAHPFSEVIHMRKKDRDCVRINPEERICPVYDEHSIKKFPIADAEEMGFPILDNFPEEHIQ